VRRAHDGQGPVNCLEGKQMLFFKTVVRSFTPSQNSAQLIDDMVTTALKLVEESHDRVLLVDAEITTLARGWLAVTVLARPLLE
jgi:transcription termination factor Rho